MIRFWSIFVVTLTLNFQGQLWDLKISAKYDPIVTSQKANISIELKVSNVTIGFDLGYDLNLEFSRSVVLFQSKELLKFLELLLTDVELPSPMTSQLNVYSVPWLLMTWQHKEPGHQQPWY